ncbi:hypothetical protein BGZ65_011251 [Modicella reniformis]|uniref:Uncharacterized protein n=1 Tax=Modicella reniformis TaxID=1440133 RepID=A0A9P6MAN3_9FUNG|nr:hypothetical protein BGZ65_011251 [Modicella reniformis]
MSQAVRNKILQEVLNGLTRLSALQPYAARQTVVAAKKLTERMEGTDDVQDRVSKSCMYSCVVQKELFYNGLFPFLDYSGKRPKEVEQEITEIEMSTLGVVGVTKESRS